ncbi:hypothetical protein EDB19DRAFT_1828062 [Suillus lakei]|nr:hypothetical protein EDB19DRAFT_1828062 [Suillus lakei]
MDTKASRGLGESSREDMAMIWPNLDGTDLQESLEIILNANTLIVYQDTTPGLTELKHRPQQYPSDLSLIDITGKELKYFLGWYLLVRNVRILQAVYQSAVYHFALPPHKIDSNDRFVQVRSPRCRQRGLQDDIRPRPAEEKISAK